MNQSCVNITTVWDTYRYCVHGMLRFANILMFEKCRSLLALNLATLKHSPEFRLP